MTGQPYPLSVARAVAVRALDEFGTERPGWRPNPDFWMNLLAESLRQMVDATAADRVIDVAPPPVVMAEFRKATGHLRESKGGQDGCTHPGCTEHDAAVTR